MGNLIYSYYVLLTDQTSLSGCPYFSLLEILENILIVIICYPDCHAIIFEINLRLLAKRFFYKTKNSEQKFKYLKNEKILLI